QARARILEAVPRLPAEEVPLAEAAGRVLAADMVAPRDLWPFPRAAMDGYGLRSQDVAAASPAHPVGLRVSGAGFAGAADPPRVDAGTAVRVATGTPVPEGADAVVPFEDVEVQGDTVWVRSSLPAGRHVFPAGEDARRGEVVLAAGTTLRGGHLGLLASLGVVTVEVVRRPQVAILAVGDELVEAGSALRPGQVVESNSYALAAEVTSAGGIPLRLGIARDDLDDLTSRIRTGLQADVLITTAGMSVGERDLVKEAMRRAGVDLLFWRVPMKPGRPVAFGLAGRTAVFGLPGTPGAAMVAFEELVRPALQAMMGGTPSRPWLPARLEAPLRVRPGRSRYLWAQAWVSPRGLWATPLRGQGTATLRSISDANALILIPPEVAELRRGDAVRVQLLAEPAVRTEPAGVPMVAVVGAKGAGKTFLIERLLPELRRRGYRVAAIKHDVHGFEIDREGTDTWRFARAGADVVAIAGPGKVAVVRGIDGEASLRQVEELVGTADLILVEGYSREPVPKIEVRRAAVSSGRPGPAGPILAVVADVPGDGSLGFEEIPALADLIERTLKPGPRGSAAARPSP
ncbi:MAG: molybdopterin-guanine dinucleotide biosynthesis protein B, partial [Armatimonadota bacterium]|nr:molybdopterin-guanine dinucleotide biosynthesis protein B [Armatimonadota bacterium]